MVENSIHETPGGSRPDKPAAAFTPLLTTRDWNEEWKELQKARRAADDASHWDKRAATFGSKDAPNPYVERFLKLAAIRRLGGRACGARHCIRHAQAHELGG